MPLTIRDLFGNVFGAKPSPDVQEVVAVNPDGTYISAGAANAINTTVANANAATTVSTPVAHVQLVDQAGFSARASKTYEGVLFANAARTTSQSSAIQQNDSQVGVMCFVNVTAIVGGPGLGIQPVLYAVDPATALPVQLATMPKITATGMYIFGTSDGSTAANFGSYPLPRTWYVGVNVSDATSYSYSVGYSTIF